MKKQHPNQPIPERLPPPQPKPIQRKPKPLQPKPPERKPKPPRNDSLRRAYSISQKIKIGKLYMNIPRGKKENWCKKNKVSDTVARRCTRELMQNILLSNQQKRQFCRTRYNKGKGAYPTDETLLFEKFSRRRADKYRVTGPWLKAQMKHLVKKSHPQVDISNKFGNRWLRDWCRRFDVTYQKKTNSKSKSIMARIHQIKNYDFWQIYKMAFLKPCDQEINPPKKKKKKKQGAKGPIEEKLDRELQEMPDAELDSDVEIEWD